ncbi:NAD(P) transhydrogenase subunit alpha [Sphingomonas mesophila]|uniref:NAD(P) transhydrogenase subunit alpha n=1 Tax=Sphingomonas mesophila TaxID=2303576 RepID=UPI000E589E53|nr:NAD(P) transhydrogenase subunit alpha [Sphingomonas mesophila]
MKLAVLAERAPETRVAAIPETVRKYVALGATVAVEEGAGIAASVPDAAFAEAGAELAARSAAVAGADIILAVGPPDPASLAGAKPGALLVGALDPVRRADLIAAYRSAGLEPLALERMPRITRAQSMDILSSQANLAGYKAVVDAAAAFRRVLPMMMTAAGTIGPARLFVMGVGVAGLQAIATGRRLGAQVSATDVRSATREQILSLGAKPIFVEGVAGIEGEGQGGYASETSAEYQAAQAELVSAHIAKQDIVVTTALIPGRPAPRLVSDAQLASMRPGSVVVDLAAEAGGNVEGVVAGETVERHGVTLIGAVQLARSLAADASGLYARNLANFLTAFWDKDSGALKLPDDDEIVAALRIPAAS